ncbi:hypothetical protein P4133_35385 [Pseudomonas aeruginosa]|nr:hypothetical protein [Pseudomonas aeruginosa]MDF5996994.1 hypothetical protein [Pseudomonas aeruginosa]
MKEIRSQQIRRRNNMLSELAELIVEAFVRNGFLGRRRCPSRRRWRSSCIGAGPV